MYKIAIKFITALILLMLLLVTPNLASQTPADSLIKVLHYTHNQEQQLEVLYQIVLKVYPDLPDTALHFAQRQRFLAKKLHNDSYYLSAIWQLGKIYKVKRDFSEAAKYFIKVYSFSEQIQKPEKAAFALYSIGQLFYHSHDFHNAILYLNKALAIYRLRDMNRRQANANYELARSYIGLKNFEKAVFHLQQCLLINDNRQNKGLASKAHNYLGVVYYNTEEFADAIEEYSIAREYAVELPDYSKKCAISFNNIGEVYTKMLDYDEADAYFRKALVLKRQLGNQEFVAGTLINLGKLKLKQYKPDSAIAYLEEIINILDWGQISQHLEEAAVLLMEAYNSKADLGSEEIRKMTKFNKAFIEHTQKLKYKKVQNRMLSLIVEKELEDEADYHFKKAESTYYRSLMITVIAILVIVGLLTRLYYRQRRFNNFVKNLWKDIKDI